MRKILKKIHLLLSIPVGLFISLICFTGAILVFDKEIDELIHPERFYVSDEYSSKSPLPLDELVKQVNIQLDTNSVKSLTVFAEKNRTYTADLKKGGRITIYIHPHTGKILFEEVYNQTFYFKVMSLHRWLMDKPSGIGKKIVGYTTIVFLIISITGLMLWIPTSRRQLKNRFVISVNKSFRRFLYDLHAVGGMYVFIFLILLCATGLAFSFPAFKKTLENTFVEKKTANANQITDDSQAKTREKENDVKKDTLTLATNVMPNFTETIKSKESKIENNALQKSLDSLTIHFNNFEYITIEPTRATILQKNAPHERATETALLNKKTGEVKKITPYAESNSSARFNGWLYSLHVGSYWGIVSKILTFVAALIGGLLPLTGYYLYFKRIKRIK